MRLDAIIGERLGRYQVEALVGRGGMAAVYRAFDPALHRHVALKVLYPHFLADNDLVERFRREAITAARLDHPNIAPIYDVGDSNDLVYLAMKLLPGPSLADLLQREGRLPLARVVAIVGEIASALQEAHSQGIVHRDIKPGNVIFDARGHAILTDFGIAKSLEASSLTESSVMIGTPDYIAPEQIDCSLVAGGQIDGRADIYALGAMLYRMLTGQRPFTGVGQGVLLAHLRDNPLPPSSLVPELPPVVDSIVQKAMAKRPEDRYATGADLAHELEMALGEETAIGAITPPPRASSQRPSPTLAFPTPTAVHPPAAMAAAPASTPRSPRRRVRWLLPAALTLVVLLGSLLFQLGVPGALFLGRPWGDVVDPLLAGGDGTAGVRPTARLSWTSGPVTAESTDTSSEPATVAVATATSEPSATMTPEPTAMATSQPTAASQDLAVRAEATPAPIAGSSRPGSTQPLGSSPTPPATATAEQPSPTSAPPVSTPTVAAPSPSATVPAPTASNTAVPPTATASVTAVPATTTPSATVRPATPSPTTAPATATSTEVPPTPTASPTRPAPTPTMPPPPTQTIAPGASPTMASVACAAPLEGGFGKLWRGDEVLRLELGCPVRGESASWSAEQSFEGGAMYWLSASQRIYVLIGGLSGRWRTYPNTWKDGDQLSPLEPPPGLYPPERGFGDVWRRYAEVSEALGWATQPEQGMTGVYQRFDHGTMLYTQELNGHGRQIYVLFADGTYTTYPDTH